ncbi:MAG: type II toxin-antitoxin system PemK/MazF family toxin [Acidimicrobiia bacterium]|nr:type II toxin-antitoxin system PemK/MazF family toxin [Acidimicrobiia bacterium]
MVARGEVWWHEGPDEKRRPYLVLTRDEGIAVLNQFLAVPATRVIRSIPTEVRLGPTDGMPEECVLAVDNLRTIRKAYLTEHITTLDDLTVSRVCEALAFAVNC